MVENVQVRDAKARLSALIEAAEQGRSTTIKRHGRPAAVIVPVKDVRKLYPQESPSFADLLLTFPGGLDLERDATALHVDPVAAAV
ncbi:type II toxin-antitoxin system Phd/YefM family antitoxin [Ottowia thiooxydans]|uniref:type II toxin-antitoxin system Phd/YefM family antitoxin n=1 Tax=Ottowia thiooxydans TaxID=219182 RepID=UPI0003FA0B02|nr:type II toxin-antitoxin system Phd/YefM family antitoxin [Ottowia thiooxydans]